MIRIIVTFVIIFLNVFYSCSVVRVEEGEIAGTTMTLANGRIINAFLSVPYASPPIGKYRFREPQSFKPWTGVWNATTLPSKCLQYHHFSYDIQGDEDCLYLNIYSPQLSNDRMDPLMDVLVYIHGGAFMFGSGSEYRPDYVLRENNIILVFINYRLGTLGFLSSGDHVVPGNNGLKDQVAALKWLRRNIVHFGGNADRVTLAGCSAGGASVHYHYLSPMSNGLFQKGISFSGSALLPWSLSKNNTDKSFHLATLVGCPTDDTNEMVKCLRSRPARHILTAGIFFQPWRFSPFTPFGPTIEPSSPNAFLSDDPFQLLSQGRFKKLSWIVSVTKDEGLYPGSDFVNNGDALEQLDEQWNDIAPHLFFFNFSVNSNTEKAKISSSIRNFYLGNQSITKETVSKVIEALGHRLFFIDIIRTVELHASASEKDVYCYMFNYRGQYSLPNFFTENDIDYGVSHFDDQLFLFSVQNTTAPQTMSDSAVISFMNSLVIQFMKTGNPAINDVVWEPLSKNVNTNLLRCLHINSFDNQKMGDISYPKAFDFWQSVLPSEYSTV